MNTIKAHAYSCFPPVIRALKRSYDDTERRTRWWRLETSTTTVPSKTLRSLTVHGIVQRWPEGRAVVSYMNINRHMPECEWTFDPACHPLDGPCTLISRCQGKPLQVEGKDSRDNDSRPTETSAWYSVGARSQPRWKLARFNLLPIASTDKRFYLFPVDDMPVNEDISTSVGDGSHPVDGFVNFWDWKTLSNTIWTLRDEDIEQSNTVMTDNRQMIEWSEWNHGSGVQYDL